jgi:hypothetical protein
VIGVRNGSCRSGCGGSGGSRPPARPTALPGTATAQAIAPSVPMSRDAASTSACATKPCITRTKRPCALGPDLGFGRSKRPWGTCAAGLRAPCRCYSECPRGGRRWVRREWASGRVEWRPRASVLEARRPGLGAVQLPAKRSQFPVDNGAFRSHRKSGMHWRCTFVKRGQRAPIGSCSFVGARRSAQTL